jgi:hypothetical protein
MERIPVRGTSVIPDVWEGRVIAVILSSDTDVVE